jgi:hypothetical protein
MNVSADGPTLKLNTGYGSAKATVKQTKCYHRWSGSVMGLRGASPLRGVTKKLDVSMKKHTQSQRRLWAQKIRN